ncbi:MAG: hypothetical protein HQM14_01180 [SAR324 cluster bacterium]|nr:hypothetical protein [SAR324 cluster bacterium]
MEKTDHKKKNTRQVYESVMKELNLLVEKGSLYDLYAIENNVKNAIQKVKRDAADKQVLKVIELMSARVKDGLMTPDAFVLEVNSLASDYRFSLSKLPAELFDGINNKTYSIAQNGSDRSIAIH